MTTPNFLKIKESTLLLLLILLLAAILRLYGIGWDSGTYLHPDERMIAMVADKLRLPENSLEWSAIFTPASTLNPNFFAYGSLPLYLLKTASSLAGWLNPALSGFAGLYLLGRPLSALFDLGTVFILYLLGKSLLNPRTGLLAAFLYASAVLPIQLAHFYAVDTPLTFFTVLALYSAVSFLKNPSKGLVILMGTVFGLALATKTSALLLAVPLGLSLLIKAYKRPLLLASYGLLLIIAAGASFLTTEPFALIDYKNFYLQTLAQSQMTKDAFTFPYTLQYVGKTPYWHELKNIFLWGAGPILGVLAFSGSIFFIYKTLRPINLKYLPLTAFFLVYLAVTGRFAVGFMRYMLPIYPLLCLFAAFLLYHLKLPGLSKSPRIILYLLLFILLLVWPLSFMHIYTQPNTRLQATAWITQNIPAGSTLAIEHWDDALPVGTAASFNIETLELYNPDSPEKWRKVKEQLAASDYLILASHRLYVPLMKLTECSKLPPYRCYRQTAGYYQNLFAGRLGFEKTAEFSVTPALPLINTPIDDFSADESFTVYDHPKVTVFKKTSS